MTLWFLMMMLCSAAAVAISYPLIRRYDARDGAAEESAVYQDQIKEVDRDLSAGTIAEPEAKVAKAEIERRLEAVARDQVPSQPLPNGWRLVALAASAGLVILGGINLYAYMGDPNMPSAVPPRPAQQAAMQQPVQQTQTSDASQNASATANQVDVMIGNLKDKLKADPNNAEGWRMLGWALFNTQHWQESADAYTKALALDPNNVDYKSALAESIVQAAQGVVTPKAQELIADVLSKAPRDLRARFYDALGHEQSGDQQGALDRWSALLADAPADAGWRDDVKQRVADLGKAMGKDVTGLLKVAPAPAAAAAPQAAAPEKDAMVAGMIAKLAQKLEANPKDRDGWAMMIRSLIVTGDKKGADEALAKALDIFKDDTATQDGLKQIATDATQKMAGKATGADANAAGGAASPSLPAGSAAPQISADQQAAVLAMPAQDQQAMIQGMVQKLSDRLKDNPKDMDGWVRLMRAYQVLKDADKAKSALSDSLKAFDGDQASIDKLKAAATELGIN
jgi:cytochrome c-type biogenesis protein CcmH